MIFRNLLIFSRYVGKRKTIYLKVPRCFLSTESFNLSYSKFQPVVEESVDPTPVIVLHGFLGSKLNWRGLARTIAERSRRQVYALDARNHGDSPHSDDFSYGLMAEDVRHFMELENIPNAVIVGHSMGGRTAMKLALTQKQLVHKLVVIDISPLKMPDSSAVLIPSYMDAMQAALPVAQHLGIVQARKVVDDHMAQSVTNVAIRQFLLTNLIKVGDKICWKCNMDVLQKKFHRIYEFSENDEDPSVYSGETLFIAGSESPYVKAEDYPLIRKIFPKAKFVEISGAGHWVHSEKPAEFLEALCNFL